MADRKGPEGTTGIRVHFIEIDLDWFDRLTVEDNDGNSQYWNDSGLSDVWSDWFVGDELTVTLVSDFSDSYNGFRIDLYEAEGPFIPVPGVHMRLAPGPVTVFTGSDGSYRFDNLSQGTYDVIPTLSGFTFTPPNRVITVPANRYVSGVSFTTN